MITILKISNFPKCANFSQRRVRINPAYDCSEEKRFDPGEISQTGTKFEMTNLHAQDLHRKHVLIEYSELEPLLLQYKKMISDQNSGTKFELGE